MKHSNPNQYVLPYEAAKGELLSQLRMLRHVDLGLSAGRSEGVVQLLERLALLGNDLREIDGIVRVKAQVIAIAARVDGRNTVSDRTVRNWQTDARQLGVLIVDVRSHKYGRKEWNVYTINVTTIRGLIRGANYAGNEGGNGRKCAETIAAPRAVSIAAPRAESIAAPLHGLITGNTHTPLSRKADTQPTDTRSRSRTVTQGAAVSAFSRLGVGRATTLVAQAIARGCDTRSLVAIARWYQRSQRRWPKRWQKPSTVLMLRLADAQPGLPAWLGWIPGTQEQSDPDGRRHSSHKWQSQQDHEQRKREAATLAATGPTMREMYEMARANGESKI
jgi:hypothetical protein